MAETNIVKNDIPNFETIEALKEYYDVKKNPEKYKKYSNFNELKKEIIKEE
ncbi:MAG: hypothetical protein LUC92_09875 [Clostridiales bacterium]|nr:hypothetical protein [Clostridiales bacterium]